MALADIAEVSELRAPLILILTHTLVEVENLLRQLIFCHFHHPVVARLLGLHAVGLSDATDAYEATLHLAPIPNAVLNEALENSYVEVAVGVSAGLHQNLLTAWRMHLPTLYKLLQEEASLYEEISQHESIRHAMPGTADAVDSTVWDRRIMAPTFTLMLTPLQILTSLLTEWHPHLASP